MSTRTTPVASLRAELLAAAQSWHSEDKPSQSADIFFPPAHIRALALDRPLVIGMRGAGKSFWSEVLTDERLRPAIPQFVRGYDRLVRVCSIRWDQGGAFSTRLPDSSVLTTVLHEGLEPRLMWLALILNELREECRLRNIALEMPVLSENWTVGLRWAKDAPDAIRRAFEQLNDALARSDQVVLVVIDALDRMAAQLNQSIDFLRGLLQLLLDARQLKGLRFKVFLREDMTNMSSVLSFPDASKLINEAVQLKWSREDIYALHWHKLAQLSNTFQKLLERHFGPSEASTNGYRHPLLTQSPDATQLTKLLSHLAPPYMGSNVRKGHVYSWWYKHLTDGKERVSPRTFSASLKEALSASQKPGAAHVLIPAGIEQGVRAASAERIKELEEDYFWVHKALAAFNDRLTPASVQEIYGVWNGVGIDGEPTPRIIQQLCLKRAIFVPWDESDRLKTPSQKLRDTLVDLGILILRDEDTRLDMPDIYRLGYSIRKRGGVSPRR